MDGVLKRINFFYNKGVIILTGEINNLYVKSDDKIKHLEFIEAVINRLNHDSFLIKGWMITIVSGFLVLAVRNCKHVIILMALLPVIIFWVLDSFYLLQERKYRDLYDDVINDKVGNFNMSINNYGNGKSTFKSAFLSITIFLLYYLICFILGIIFFCLEPYKCYETAWIVVGITILLWWCQDKFTK